MNTSRKALEDSDEVITIPAQALAYQRRTWVQVVLLIVFAAVVAMASLTWMNIRTQAALERTQHALDRANATIVELSQDNACRSKASARESAALSAVVGHFITNPDDPELPGLVQELTAATAAREAVAANGCP